MRRSIVGFLIFAFLALPAFAGIIQVDLTATGTSDVLAVEGATQGTRSMVFCGFASHETDGSSPAVVTVYNGADTSGQKIFEWSLSANESRSEGPWPASDCIGAPNGIFLERTGSGSPLVIVYYRNPR